MRRRMMLEQEPAYLITFEQFVSTMNALGFPTGTDSTGFYIDVSYPYQPSGGVHEFDGIFKPYTAYEIYIRNNKTTPGYTNLDFVYSDGRVIAPTNVDYRGASTYSDPTKTISYMKYQGYSSYRIYDFHIKEV